MNRQLSLFGSGEPSIDFGFSEIRRIELGRGAYVDHQAGWLQGHEGLFDELEERGAWKAERRSMYDKVVDIPRLTAPYPGTCPHRAIDRMLAALCLRYQAPFDRIGLAYYRDGLDGVAWHGDRVLRWRGDTHIGIVSLGAPRTFLMRPKGGGASTPWTLAPGDLLVMGGTCQREFEHCIPKRASVGPRISIVFRCSRDQGSPLPVSFESRRAHPSQMRSAKLA